MLTYVGNALYMLVKLNPAQPIVGLNPNIDSHMSGLLSQIAPEF